MILLGWNKGSFTEVLLYAGPARIHRNFPGGEGWLGHLIERIAGTKVWRPDYAASEELCIFSRTWGQGSRKTHIREACTPRKGVWLPPKAS